MGLERQVRVGYEGFCRSSEEFVLQSAEDLEISLHLHLYVLTSISMSISMSSLSMPVTAALWQHSLRKLLAQVHEDEGPVRQNPPGALHRICNYQDVEANAGSVWRVFGVGDGTMCCSQTGVYAVEPAGLQRQTVTDLLGLGLKSEWKYPEG